ncbi:hypothetical protein ALC62_13770 [Cyphomyrmex costatus]|uniref:Vitellogenin domain-containing protein n=1 Tax=Cyphomyrmex costatus TaxID=456900 RepID=A0A195C4X5_9HYME|nr:hypothetical protein ALC62_13770 [Cyphomyrmex costatus]
MIVNVSKITNFDPEYLYELNQTTIVYKEPLQITQLTSTIKCHPFPPISLRCFLHDILYVTKFEHKNLNIIEEVTRERFKIGQWFEMKFSIEGLQSTLVRKDADNIVRNAIKYFVWQFDIGINIQHFIPLFKSRFTTTVMKFEKTSIADCTTELNFDVQRMMIPPDPYLNFDFTLTMKEDYTKYQYSRFLIEKNRIDCTPTFEYNDFLNSLVIVSIRILFYMFYIFINTVLLLLEEELIVTRHLQ